MNEQALRSTVERVAKALGELAADCVLAGGCAPLFYPRDARVAPIRPTDDVDFIVSTRDYVSHARFERDLRGRGFSLPDPATGPHPTCRYELDGALVDFMPAEPVLGPTNRWYRDALARGVLPLDGLPLGGVIAPAYFVATKLVAFDDRGRNDFTGSHDLEDVVWCLRAVPAMLDDIATGQEPVHGWLRQRLRQLVADERFVDALPGHFEPDAGSQSSVPIFLRALHVACEEHP